MSALLVERVTTQAPSSDDLLPWVATLADPVQVALATLLGLELDARVAFRPASGGTIWVGIDASNGAHVELDLETGAEPSGPRAWIRKKGLSLSYRRERDGSDPFLDPARGILLHAIRSQLEATRENVLESRIASVMFNLERMERYREVEDRMYRQISSGSSQQNATIRLGFRCNQDCGMCWQGRQWPDPPEAFALAWLEQIAAAGIEQVAFTGGEPTLYRSLPELIRRATELGLGAELQTNAVLLNKGPLAKTLFDAGLRRLFVSYHSHLPEVSDALTRAPSTHAKTEAGISACLRLGMRVQLNAVIERLNVSHLAELAGAIVERFVEPFPENPVREVTFSYPSNYHDLELWRASVLPLDEVAPHLIAAARFLRARGLSVYASGTGCGFPSCVLRDEPDLIRPSNSRAMDLKDSSARTHPPACDPCALRGECPGVRREYFAVHGDRGVVPFVRA